MRTNSDANFLAQWNGRLDLGSVIMPTDLRVASERKRETQAQAQTEITIMLVMVIINLAMLVLLVADQSFSKASIELIGRLAP